MTNVSVRLITWPQAEEELAERIALGEELLNEIRHGPDGSNADGGLGRGCALARLQQPGRGGLPLRPGP